MADASTSTSASAPAAEENHPYTLETLKQHSTRDDLWLLINGKVYDVTKFMDEHPGGDEVLIEEAGRDGTEAFDDVGHSDEARDMLPKMYLGDFKGAMSEKKVKKSVGVASATASSSSSVQYSLPFITIHLHYSNLYILAECLLTPSPHSRQRAKPWLRRGHRADRYRGLTYLIPVAVIGAYLAWRLFYA